MKLLVHTSRLLVGSLFIVSGLIKANDPLGFSYKLDEYFSPTVLNMEWLAPYALALAIVISVVEVVLGLAVLLGAKPKLTSWLLLLMIVFFTFLTFYSAYFNKVTDCGCFGDALKLTPWQSFTKDVVLLVFVLIIFLNKGKIKLNSLQDNMVYGVVSLLLIAGFSFGVIGWGFPVLFSAVALLLLTVLSQTMNSKNKEWVMAVVGFILAGGFSYYCYSYLPIKDFRPYAVGKSIPEGMKIPEGAQPDVYETVLTYKNKQTGEVKEFNQDNYPWDDEGWEWVNTESKLVKKGYEPPIHDFSIIGTDGNDYTEDILSEAVVFLIITYDINKTCGAVQEEINKFVEGANNAGYYVFGVTASLYDRVEEFRHKHQNMFDYYTADETTLKTIVRSNPGIVLLKQGVIAGKWHYNGLPDFEEVQKELLK